MCKFRTISSAELLYDNGTVNQENLRRALAEDKYILNVILQSFVEMPDAAMVVILHQDWALEIISA